MNNYQDKGSGEWGSVARQKYIIYHFQTQIVFSISDSDCIVIRQFFIVFT